MAVPEDKDVQWGEVGYLTYKRTYARPVSKTRTEEYAETVDRIVKACKKQLHLDLTLEDEQLLRDVHFNLEGTVAGRFLWQLGTKTVDKLGLASLQNCATTLVNHPIKPFVWAMDMLMLGSGVGYNIQKEYVYELPKPRRIKAVRQDTNDADYIVPDSREGWVKLLGKLLKSHFYGGGDFTYSTVLIRGKGAPIKGFGGTASGAEELCWGISEINQVLNKRAGKKVRPIDCLDIMNIIGFVVVAGNVRRSAQIALGDFDDRQFLAAKRWDLGNIPKWRAMSNNSVVCNDLSLLPEDFWEGYQGNGEPYGLINLKLARAVGRANDFHYPDPDVVGVNPCSEQTLADKETCCLAEIYLPNIKSAARLREVAGILYRVCKHSLRLPCHHTDTEDIVHKNMRMGIGVTGYMQATEEQRQWLAGTYDYLRQLDKEYSAAHGMPTSVKLTTVKPSGTLSLLAGVTPGCHPGFAPFFIRRIRISSDSSLVDVCRAHGYLVEPQFNLDGSADPNTVVVSFPCKYPEHTTFAADTSAIAQLEVVKRLQTEWSDNAVSCTVYYKREELPAIREWLAREYNNNLKSCSFLLHNDHGFSQAPYEAITEKDYQEMVKGTRPITSCEVDEAEMELEECATGACPVK